jgi:hypothetical protein
MLFLWRCVGERGGHAWALYGWFSGLTMCGSIFGAVAYAAWMLHLVNDFNGHRNPNQTLEASFNASSYGWLPLYSVTYAVEFLCLSAAKLMVLDRMSVFAAPEGTGARRRWAAAGRTVMAAVVLGNAVGLAANAAAAVHYHKAAQAYRTASLYFAAGNTEDGEKFNIHGIQEVSRASYITSVQSFCELAVLLFIVVAFVVVGVMSARRVSNSIKLLRTDNFPNSGAAVTTGRALRLQIVCTTAFVFVAFLVRSAFSAMDAVANQLQDLDKACPNSTLTPDQPSCDSCYNVFSHVVEWIDHTPEFEPLIMLVSPIALLVALWGMSSKTLNLMTTKITLNILNSGQTQKLTHVEHTAAAVKVGISPSQHQSGNKVQK